MTRNRKLLDWVDAVSLRSPSPTGSSGATVRPRSTTGSASCSSSRAPSPSCPTRSARTATGPTRILPTSRGSRRGPSSAPTERGRRRAEQQLDGPRRDARHLDRVCSAERCGAGPCTSCPSPWARSVAHRQHRRGAHRLALRGREHADHDQDGRGRARGARRRRRVRAVPAFGRRAARARPAGRAVAVQPREPLHRALPRDAGDLVVRLRLRRQRPARQEVPRAADRVGDRPATKAGSPSTC